MIFISHTNADKDKIEPIARMLATVFGHDNVFYDSWAIQPGDSILGKMEEGLKKCQFFFFFVSERSLASKMVDMEWKSAILRRANGCVRFIPIKLDRCEMPILLSDTLYIDCTRYDIETVKRQILDIVQGQRIDKQRGKFQNLEAVVTFNSEYNASVSINAKCYIEPISSYLVLVKNDMANVSFYMDGLVEYHQCYKNSWNGDEVYGMRIRTQRPTSVGFPIRFSVSTKNKEPLELVEIFHEERENDFEALPIIKQYVIKV